MPIRMKATQRHYVLPLKREYDKGEEFEVPTEKEAARLVRIKRATRVLTGDAKPAQPDAQQKRYERRDMRPKGE